MPDTSDEGRNLSEFYREIRDTPFQNSTSPPGGASPGNSSAEYFSAVESLSESPRGIQSTGASVESVTSDRVQEGGNRSRNSGDPEARQRTQSLGSIQTGSQARISTSVSEGRSQGARSQGNFSTAPGGSRGGDRTTKAQLEAIRAEVALVRKELQGRRMRKRRRLTEEKFRNFSIFFASAAVLSMLFVILSIVFNWAEGLPPLFIGLFSTVITCYMALCLWHFTG